MSMRLAAIINYFLVHKMEVGNLISLSTQVLLRSQQSLSGITLGQKSPELTTKLICTIILTLNIKH